MTQQVLVVAPHPDDESIGCGGMVCVHHERGDPVTVAFLTSGERGLTHVSTESARAIREAEAIEALQILNVSQWEFLRFPDLGVGDALADVTEHLARLLNRRCPDVIYLPHPCESHPDHQACLPAIRTALKQAGRASVTELRGYEVWSPMAAYDWAEDITQQMSQKLRAVRRYRSQLQSFRYDRAIRGLNQYRGCLAARSRFAEVFQYLESVDAPQIEVVRESVA